MDYKVWGLGCRGSGCGGHSVGPGIGDHRVGAGECQGEGLGLVRSVRVIGVWGWWGVIGWGSGASSIKGSTLDSMLQPQTPTL